MSQKSLLMSHTIQNVLTFYLALHAGAAFASPTAAAECQTDLSRIAQFIEANDAGAVTHLASHGVTIAAALASARTAAGQVPDVAACDVILQSYLKAWRPTHLQLIPVTGTNTGKSAAIATSRTPQFGVLSKDTALLVLPSFNQGYGVALASLLAERRSELESRKNWIVDVRANDGGEDAGFAPLRPWLLDAHLPRHGVEYRVTPANIQSQYDICSYTRDPAGCLKQMTPLVEQMRTAPSGSFMPFAGERFGSIPVDLEARRPERVAILIDRPCGSSCEQFVLEARTSYRVKIVGRPTMGALDYSNLRPHRLGSGRVLFYATTRSTRLPDFHVDAAGIAPDILLPAPSDAAAHEAEIEQVQRWLEGGPIQSALPASGILRR